MSNVKLSFDGKATLASGIAAIVVGISCLGLIVVGLGNSSLQSIFAAGLCAGVGIILMELPLLRLADKESFLKGRKSIFVKLV